MHKAAHAAAVSRKAPRGQPDTQANANMRAGFVKEAEIMKLNAENAAAQVNDFKNDPNKYTNAQISDYSSRVVVSEATKKRQRQSQTRAVSAYGSTGQGGSQNTEGRMYESNYTSLYAGNQQIRDSQSTELKRLGGSGSIDIKQSRTN
jgi:hypothetical protein